MGHGLLSPSGDNTDAEITKILAVLEDRTNGPVFVHCQRGADLTGAVIAAYHIDHAQWDNARALEDAMAHSMSLFQLPRQKFIKNFHPITREARAPVVESTPAAAVPVSAGVQN